MLLHGIFSPVTTPFYPDGNVYLKKLEHNVERYSRTPVAGIVALGSTGEAVMLSDQERRDVLKAVRQAAAPTKVLIAGTGLESAIDTLRFTEYAAELGYDAVMIRTPHFYKKQMAAANILAFYRTVADRSPLPLLVYNVPACTQYDIPSELVIELADHPNIVGIKESSGDIEKVRRMVEGTRHVKRNATVTETFEALTPRMLAAAAEKAVAESRELVQVGVAGGSAPNLRKERADMEQSEHRDPSKGARVAPLTPPLKPSSSGVTVVGKLKTRQKEVGFQVLMGAAHKLHGSLEVGAVGGILGFACPAPTACYEVYAAWKEGDAELARLKQERIAVVTTRIVGELGVPAIKHAMDLNGYYGGLARLPLLPLTGEEKAEVERLMADMRN